MCAGAAAHAGVLSVDNGVTGTGSLVVQPDEYGAYGTWLGPQEQDLFQCAGTTSKYATWMGGAYLFVTTPSDGMRTAVLLTDQKKWITIEEPGSNTDGVIGDRLLQRTITTTNTQLATNEVQSAFTVGEPNAGPVQLAFTLDQKVTYDTASATSTFRQTYTITNIGTLDTDLGFHAHWDADLIWTNSAVDDIAGVGQGLCYVFIRDDSGADRAVSLRDGGSTVPRTYYYAGKSGVTPPLGPPVYGSTYYSQDVFNMFGMPTSWRNNLAAVGYSLPGESGVSPSTASGVDSNNAVMGTEYRFPLAIGASTTIVIDRIYGTATLTCPTPPAGSCGDGVQDPNEQCDSAGADTATCIGATCMTSTCGDGYVNAAAGEVCDSNGVDTASCIGATCQPSSCGDGYVNAAAGEECESGPLCDPTTCKTTYTVGGGCAGCAADDNRGAWWLVALVAAALTRRRARR